MTTINMINLRSVELTDAKLLYQWQIHDETRRYFLNSQKPTLQQHMDWLQKAIANQQCHLLIAEEAPIALGVLRYDVNDQQTTVSIYLNPDRHGQGLGAKLLMLGNQWLKKHVPAIQFVTATIKPNNQKSIRCFEKAGFKKQALTYQMDLS